MRFLIIELSMLFATAVASHRPRAMVYRGPATCEGCAEDAAKMLRNSPCKFSITYVGPDEKTDITAETLRKADLYVQPGGGDLDPAIPMMKPYFKTVRDYVANGGRYMGICLGAYLAGDPGFNILPPDCDADEEITQSGSAVDDERDTVIEVDWEFSSGKTKKHWLYFQDGAVMKMSSNATNVKVLGRYSSNGDIAASVSPFGRGWVGAVGPHPEATQEWYDLVNVTNPEGIDFSVGYDFVESTMSWNGKPPKQHH